MALGPKTNRKRTSAPEVQYAEHINRLEARIKQLEGTIPAIPLLDEDPAPESGVNIWAFKDGRLRVRLPVDYSTTPITYSIIEFAAVAVPGPGNNTVGALPALPTGPQTYLNRYPATWCQTYNSLGDKRLDLPGVVAYGYQGSIHKRCRALLGFDYTTIAADLANSTVLSVQLELQMLNSVHATTTAFFGVHNFTAAPLTWTGTGLLASQIVDATFVPNLLQVCDLTLLFATAIRGGTGKGIAIEAPTDGEPFAGQASAVGSLSGYPDATLIIEFAK